MTSGEQYTFWELIKRYKIVVPKIQRDYVQGRKNVTVAKNRKEFVEELVEAIKNDKPMSLNFIYGTIRENDFIPIDGQQRLTTLFLLHLYAFAKTEKGEMINFLKEKFSYQTRYTTNRFIEKLAENLPAILKSLKKEENDLFDVIHKSGWYASSWDNDPNVVSCLVMLQLIHETWENMINTDELTEDWKITFMFLRLEEFGSDNRLYIRMNSRGKQLTDFENFKAELYEKVLKGDKCEKEKEFKSKIDGDWYSMLWKYAVIKAEDKAKDKAKDIEEKARLIDALMKRIIHWTIVGKAAKSAKSKGIEATKSKQSKKEKTITEDDLRKRELQDLLYQYCQPSHEQIDILRCDVDQYRILTGKDNSELCETFLCDLSNLLKFLWTIKEEGVFQFIANDILSISQGKKSVTFMIDSYAPRVLLYAVTFFANKKIDQQNKIACFKSFYRVILNLVSTTEIGSPSDFQKAVVAISNWDGDTEKWLKETDFKGAFREAQIKEEILKLELVKNCDWESAIRNAEKTDFDQGYQERDYFRGQIGFLLLMSKEDGDYNVNKFNKICEAAKKFFIDEYDDNLFHRALLTYGDYGTELKSINQEESSRTVSYGITTYFRKTRIHGAPDWRDALIVVNWDKEGSCKANKVYIALKSFIEEFINTSSTELKKFQNDKLEEYKNKIRQHNDGLPASLQDKLIMKRKMFEFTDNYFIKKEEKDILLRSKTKTGEKGRNWDYVDEYYDSSEGEEGQTP